MHINCTLLTQILTMAISLRDVPSSSLLPKQQKPSWSCFKYGFSDQILSLCREPQSMRRMRWGRVLELQQEGLSHRVGEPLRAEGIQWHPFHFSPIERLQLVSHSGAVIMGPVSVTQLERGSWRCGLWATGTSLQFCWARATESQRSATFSSERKLLY